MSNEQLKSIADAYFNGLIAGDVSVVPYHDQVTLRTPLAAGGGESPILGRDAVLSFFSGIYAALEAVSVTGYFYSQDATALSVKATIVLKSGKSLRVMDLFVVDANGQVIKQENHYDPRPALG
jgi:hypothetical protein